MVYAVMSEVMQFEWGKKKITRASAIGVLDEPLPGCLR